MTQNPSTFSLFPHLPPEIRLMIWQQALPDNAPTLYPCIKGRSGPNPDPSNAWDGVGADRTENGNWDGNVYLELPLFFVSREAHRIAAAWVRRQGLQIGFCEDRQSHAFLRPYDMDRDALYVPADEISQLSATGPDMFGHVCCPEPSLARVAVPEDMFCQDSDALADLLGLFLMETLYVIVGAQPDPRDESSTQASSGRWELGCTQGNRALVWSRSRGCFDWRDGKYIGSESLHRRMEEASKELVRTLDWMTVDSFEMLPVSAVRQS